MLRHAGWWAVAALLLACGEDEPATSDDDGGGGSGLGGSVGGGDVGGAAAICARWNADRANLSEGAWSGDVSSCDPGDISAEGRDNTLRMVNLYRFLAGLPEVSTDATLDAKAQACSLMMHANDALSHTPPTSWSCYSNDGAEAAGKSNLATAPGVMAVDLYMADPGNETTMGHRRWILSNGLGPIGLGSTSGFSCMWVLGSFGAGPSFTAFPSPGPFPVEAMTAAFASVDSTGWTIQSDTLDLTDAVVTVSDAGEALPITVTALLPNYGSSAALRFNPQGWSAEAGHTYRVEITGVASPFSYDVEMVACE